MSFFILQINGDPFQLISSSEPQMCLSFFSDSGKVEVFLSVCTANNMNQIFRFLRDNDNNSFEGKIYDIGQQFCLGRNVNTRQVVMKSTTDCNDGWGIQGNGALENTTPRNYCMKRNGVKVIMIECDEDDVETWSLFNPTLHPPQNFIVTEKNSFPTIEDIVGIFSFDEAKNDTLVAIYPATEDPSSLSISGFAMLLNLCQNMMNGTCHSDTGTTTGTIIFKQNNSSALSDGEWRMHLINNNQQAPYRAELSSNSFRIVTIDESSCDVEDRWRIGDGACDQQHDWKYNSKECGYDGGDCVEVP